MYEVERESDQLLKVEDVQRILGIGKTQAYALISSRAIASIRIGRRSLRVRKADLDDFIASNRRDG